MSSLLIAAASIVILLERLPRFRFRKSALLRPNAISDAVYLLTGFVAGGSLATAYVAASSEQLEKLFALPRLVSMDLPLWISIPSALLAVDFGNYIAHWLLHRYDVLWEFHKIHHSSPMLDWLAAFRSHLFEQTLRRLIAPALLILFGFPLKAVLIAGALFIAWAMFIHSNLRVELRFIEPILITPRLHRVHHRFRTSEMNLGSFFTFWDRMRGSFTLTEIDADAEFGNGDPAYPQSWHRQFIEPLIGFSSIFSPQRSQRDL